MLAGASDTIATVFHWLGTIVWALVAYYPCWPAWAIWSLNTAWPCSFDNTNDSELIVGQWMTNYVYTVCNKLDYFSFNIKLLLILRSPNDTRRPSLQQWKNRMDQKTECIKKQNGQSTCNKMLVFHCYIIWIIWQILNTNCGIYLLHSAILY